MIRRSLIAFWIAFVIAGVYAQTPIAPYPQSPIMSGPGGGGSTVPSTTCTNQFIRSIAAGGAGTCASIANADLGTTLTPQFAGVKVTNGGAIFPSSNSTTALLVTKADGSTAILTFDTTNGIVRAASDFQVNTGGALVADTWKGFTGHNLTAGDGSGTTFLSGTGLKITNATNIFPSTDSTTALVFTKADASTAVLTLDTTNKRVSTSGNLGVGVTADASTPIVGTESTTVPILAGSAHPTTGIGQYAGGYTLFFNGGVPVVLLGSSLMRNKSDAVIGWTNGTGDVSAVNNDTAFCRNAANIVEINNGSCGTFADLKLRTIIHPTTTAVAVANVGANSCGTTAATIAGNENVGAFTVGATSGTQCRITFTTTAPTRRHCTFDDETTTTAVRSTYVDTTHTDAIGAFVAGDVVSYICAAR